MAYHIRSFRHLCSATFSGHVAKCSSSASVLERRYSILYLTAAVSCKEGYQGNTLRRGLYGANFFVKVSGRDGLQDSHERTESVGGLIHDIRGSFCDIDDSCGGSERCVLVVALRNWWMLAENKCHPHQHVPASTLDSSSSSLLMFPTPSSQGDKPINISHNSGSQKHSPEGPLPGSSPTTLPVVGGFGAGTLSSISLA